MSVPTVHFDPAAVSCRRHEWQPVWVVLRDGETCWVDESGDPIFEVCTACHDTRHQAEEITLVPALATKEKP